jgi:hypothetical protein
LAKLIYIGGYGRSGSTLLEYLLASNPALVACGEVERHLRRFGKRKICTCGRRAKKCSVWGNFQHGRLKNWDHKQLTWAMLEYVSSEYAVMVDSSKTSWGSTFAPFRLSRNLGENFLLVHLVRDPRAVAWSTMKSLRPASKPKLKVRSLSPRARSLRTVGGWTVANLACEMFGFFHPDRYMRLRYEDLVGEPFESLKQIFARVDLEPPATLEQNENRRNRHQLYGNAMRFETLLPTDLKEDVAWRTTMPKAYRWLVGSLCLPFCLRYSYALVPKTVSHRQKKQAPDVPVSR